MKKMTFWGGVVAGAIVGSAITMLADPVSDRDRRRLARSTHNIFRSVGAVIDNMMR